MDLLLIARKIWRYKLATLPVLILTLCGAAYVVAVKDAVYEVSSSYVLINPPEPPTSEEIARDPALGRIKTDNPYTRFAEQSVVVEVLASTLDSKTARRTLTRAGADDRYTVAPTQELGYSTPIVEITGVGNSAQKAVRTAKVVGQAVARQLARMQQAEGVDQQYWIKTRQVDAPDNAQLRASGQLRMLVGVLALGVVLLFIVVSAADGLTTFRMEQAERATRPRRAGDEAWSAEHKPVEDGSGLDVDDWSGFRGAPYGGEPLDLFPDPASEAQAPINGRPASGLRSPPDQRSNR